jgi:hypothetical protein
MRILEKYRVTGLITDLYLPTVPLLVDYKSNI